MTTVELIEAFLLERHYRPQTIFYDPAFNLVAEFCNIILEEAAQEVENDSNIHSLDAGRLAEKIRALKIKE